jgi:hypothetical protein
MRTSFPSLLVASITLVLAGSLLTGCSSKKKPQAVSQTATTGAEKPSFAEQIDTTLTARVQAISRKNRILTLKFPDDKVAKVKVGPEVKNFSEIGVGDTITVDFRDEVEVYVLGPGGKPAWSEVEEIKKAPKGVKPGAAIIRAYEYTATVAEIDYATRKVKLNGPNKTQIEVVGGPQVKRFNEIKQGDTLVARLIEAVDIKVTPPERPSSSSRPYRRR